MEDQRGKKTNRKREGGRERWKGNAAQHTQAYMHTYKRKIRGGFVVQSVVGKKANKKKHHAGSRENKHETKKSNEEGARKGGKKRETDALLALRKDSLTEVTAAKDRAHEGAMAHASTPLWCNKNIGTVSAFLAFLP